MANRKTTGSRKTNTNTNTSRRRSGSSSQSSAKSRSTRSSSSRTSRPKTDDKVKRDLIFCIMILIMLFIFACLIGFVKGSVGPFIKSFMLGTFGILGFVMPLLIFLAVWMAVANKGSGFGMIKVIACYVLTFTIGIFLALVSPSDISGFASMEDGLIKALYQAETGGGVIFGFLAVLLVRWLALAGACVFDILIGIFCIFFISGKSISAFVSSLFSHVIYDHEGDDEEDEYDYDRPALADKLAEKGKKIEALVDKKYIEEKENEKNLNNSDIITSDDDRDALIEERRRKREQKNNEKLTKEEQRKKELDRMDDERIVNAHTPAKAPKGINLNDSLIGPADNKVTSKDDMHYINVCSFEDNEDAGNSSKISEVASVNKPSHAAMEEITSQDFDSLGSSSSAERNMSHHTDISEINAPTDDNKDSNYSEYNAENNTSFITASVNKKDEINENKIISNTFSDSNSVNNNENNSEKNSAEMEFNRPDAALKTPDGWVTVNPNVSPLETPGLESMPDPVTERTHAKNEINISPTANDKVRKVVHNRNDYKAPKIDLLKKNDKKKGGDSDKELKETALKLQECLKTFGVPVQVSDISQGPSVTRYELTLGEGIKVNKIVSLTDDIKLNLAAQDIRIEAPIPGKAAVGIEIPNKVTSDVLGRDLIESSEFKNATSNITFAVGKDITGKTIVADIAKMPHMLIAGSTGSGKSVCINTLIMSILYKAHPDDVKLIMIDPKVVELSVYNGIPHLMIPVVTDPKKASAALKWAVNEMTNRYRAFEKFSVRDLKGYNEKVSEMQKRKDPDAPEILPQIIVIVDELADLMMVAGKEVEESICRLAQLARAAGIHLIIATQRPSVDVITGLIKANMPSRVAFRVSSGVDSRTILDMVGAERLLGKGDMLFYPQGYSKPLRVQGAFVSDKEVTDVVEYLINNNPGYSADSGVDSLISGMTSSEGAASSSGEDKGSDVDEYFKEACRFVVDKGSASSGMLQRIYRIGFNRAARMVDQMEAAGIVGSEQGTKPRSVLVDKITLEEILKNY